jgi:acyl dehydratase
MPKRFFEDFAVGDTFPLPAREITKADVIAFAEEFDPQPIHVDETAPATHEIGGLIASGWHVCAEFMRMFCEGLLLDSNALGAPGVDTLKWQRPVKPGDNLSGRAIILETRTSRSRPDVGILRLRQEVFNQAGERVMWMEHPMLMRRRDPS